MFTKEVFVQKTRRWENNIYYKMAKSYSMLGKILYAEDDFLTREIVGEKLEEEGYAVVLACPLQLLPLNTEFRLSGSILIPKL